ncbi:MAG: hypothetical protein MK193_04325 [Lentisphaeria bacterium]|nr:hypothetical protein [Lentisphaeria bacterium]
MSNHEIDWLQQELETSKSRYLLVEKICLCGFFIMCLYAGLFVLGIMDFLVRFPNIVALLLTISIFTAVSYFWAKVKRKRIVQLESTEMIARFVEKILSRETAEHKSLFINALQFGTNEQLTGSEALKEQIIKQARESGLKPSDIQLYEDKSIKRLKQAIVIILGLLVFQLVTWSYSSIAMQRLIGMRVLYPTRTIIDEIQYSPVPVAVGDEQQLLVYASGKLPQTGYWWINDGEQQFAIELKLMEGQDNQYVASYRPENTYEAWVELGDATSLKEQVDVYPSPGIDKGILEVTAPSYMNQQLDEQLLGNNYVPAGATAKVRITPNVKLAECKLILAETTVDLKQENGTFYYQFNMIDKTFDYQVYMKDIHGLEQLIQKRYTVRVVQDKLVRFRLDEPESSFSKIKTGRYSIVGRATDDYGIKRIILKGTIFRAIENPKDEFDDREDEIALPEKVICEATDEVKVSVNLNTQVLLSQYDFEVGDRIEFYLEGEDELQQEGRLASSEKWELSILSKEQMREFILQDRELVFNQLQNLQEDEERQVEMLKERLEKLQ